MASLSTADVEIIWKFQYRIAFYVGDEKVGTWTMSHMPRQLDHIILNDKHYGILSIFLCPETDTTRIAIAPFASSPRYPGDREPTEVTVEPGPALLTEDLPKKPGRRKKSE